MPVNPKKYEEYSNLIRKIYAEAEATMIRIVAERLKEGIDDESWSQRKLSEIRLLRKKIEKELQGLGKYKKDIQSEIEKAYKAGSDEAVRELTPIMKNISAGFTHTHTLAIQALAEKTVDKLAKSHMMILRTTEDIYRQVIAEAAPRASTGTMTRRQAAQVALNRFADRGIYAFVDRAGRRWDMASYAEMAVRSTTGQAAIEGHINRFQENGKDLVWVSNSPDECDRCRPWEGKILSISGENERYPSVARARGAGLFHPSCTHNLSLYVEGLTELPQGGQWANPRGYELRQKQRYIERRIRQWKRREAAALSEEEAAYARSKVREWQATMRKFINDTDRRRDYARESITGAR